MYLFAKGVLIHSVHSILSSSAVFHILTEDDFQCPIFLEDQSANGTYVRIALSRRYKYRKAPYRPLSRTQIERLDAVGFEWCRKKGTENEIIVHMYDLAVT
jgi:hypothetical protein